MYPLNNDGKDGIDHDDVIVTSNKRSVGNHGKKGSENKTTSKG